jgi:hypothetical protein
MINYILNPSSLAHYADSSYVDVAGEVIERGTVARLTG